VHYEFIKGPYGYQQKRWQWRRRSAIPVLVDGTPDMENWLAMAVDSAKCSREEKWIESNETVVIQPEYLIEQIVVVLYPN
jgi:hypothetical protein